MSICNCDANQLRWRLPCLRAPRIERIFGLNTEHRKRRPPAKGDGQAPSGAQGGRGRNAPRRQPRGAGGAGGGSIWLYGRHAALAALANPAREIERVRATPGFQEHYGETLTRLGAGQNWPVETADGAALDRLFGEDAVHQGVVVATRPLEQPDVSEIRAMDDSAVVLVLDQASDPRNVGAVIRAAAAFGALAVVTTLRGAPPETAALAKAAAGALEAVPYIQATNLARALDTLKANGFWSVGLEGSADMLLADAPFDRPIALVLGGEGRGLRRLTADVCDALVRIPIAPGVESLNVATAAAIALYERRRGVGSV